MIMGNTDIALPTDQTENAADPSIGIPDGLTQQESRSLLKDEIAKDCLPCSLTVSPAFGLQGRKTPMAEKQPNKPMTSSKQLSWAELVSK
jgi:hypothetical protein